MARPPFGELPPRCGLLEDALFLAKSGLKDNAIMARQGYTNRASWLRSLTRAGLPKTGNTGLRAPDLRTRLFDYAPDPPAEVEHGTVTMYCTRKCRCAECRRFNAVRSSNDRWKRLIRGVAPDDPRHGTAYLYGSYGCRCEPCTKANSAACADYRVRNGRA